MRDTEVINVNINSDMDSVARNEEYILENTSSNELTIIENNSVFVQTAGISDNVQLNMLREKHGIVVASAGNIKSFDHHGSTFSKMFPELFPFGRGHPAEVRKNRVSLLECVKYYMDLSSRRFAQHHQFLAVAFDKISLGNMFMYNYLQCKKNSQNNEIIAKVTADELNSFLTQKTTKSNIIQPHTNNAEILMNSKYYEFKQMFIYVFYMIFLV